MDNLTVLTYTNSKCTDVHNMYFDSYNKFFTNENHVVLTDEVINRADIKQIIYNNHDSYSDSLLLALSEIKTKYVIYSQEDYILFDFVKIELLKKYIKVLENNDEVMFIRLIHAGIDGSEKMFNDELLVINPDNEYYFSTQITIWKREYFEKLFSVSKTVSVTDEPKNSPFLKSFNKQGLCVLSKGDRVGYHFNSIVFPYIATAIIKGKWNMSQYGNHLNKLMVDYNINVNDRGEV